MADKVCANCGAEVPAAAVFCTQCGSRDLTEAPSSPPVSPAATIAPDSPTVPVERTHEPPTPAAPAGATAAAPPDTTDEPTRADHTIVADPTTVWSPPPEAPLPAPPVAAPPGPVPPPYAPPTPAPTRVAPPVAARPAAGGGRIGAVLALIGGAAAIVGSFLEWMKITPDWAGAVTLNGWNLSDDAKIAAAVGAVAVVAAFVVLGGMLRSPMRIIVALAGIVLIAIGAYDTYDILQRLPDDLSAANVSGVEIAAPGIGLILVIAGGAAVLLGALAMVGPRRAMPATAPTSPEPFGGPPPPTGVGAAVPPAGGYAPPQDASPAPFPASGPPTGGYGPPPAGHAPPSPGGYPPPPPPPFC